MPAHSQQDRAWLLATAKVVAEGLKTRTDGTRLRVRIPSRATKTADTDGWRAAIGDLGKGKPHLEVWFDRFSGYQERKLYACFFSQVRPQLASVTERVSKQLWPVREISPADVVDGKYAVLAVRLARAEFNAPILERHSQGCTFYGIYDPTRATEEPVNRHFCNRAIAFFEDVARSLPNAKAEDEQREVYPRFENRKLVASHLHRERSKLLAAECKIHDNYKCQVCSLRFVDAYGSLGSEFAEAHHLIPLSRLREKVRTRIEDLTTVCANCHRMLHRMKGHRDDIKKLKTIIRNHR